MGVSSKKMGIWVRLLTVFLTVLFSGHGANAQDKRGASMLPSKAVLVAPKASVVAAKQGNGPFADGLWHMTFGTQIDVRGCSLIEQESLAEDDKPLYVCRSGDDDRFHAIHGNKFGPAFVRIRDLTFQMGKVEYLAQAEDGTWWHMSGQEKTAASAPSSRWGTPFRGAHPLSDDEDPSMPALPEKNACGIKVRGPQYILANGDPLVTLRNHVTDKQYVCWGQEKGPEYKSISSLDFVGGHVRYIAKTDDGLFHVVKDRQIGKGYVEVAGVTYDTDRNVYLAQDDQGGKWHLVQDANEGPAFDEVGPLHYSPTSRKTMFAARRSTSRGQPGL